MNNITISVVSHGQGSILRNLIFKLNKYSTFISKVVITLNIPERLDINSFNFSFELVYIENASPKGFAENHNQAFAKCSSDFFCVMNPDIDLDNEDYYCIIVSSEKFDSTSVELEKNKIKIEGSISLVPNNTVKVSGNDANQLLKLLNLLENHEDVQKVYSNCDIDVKDLNDVV